MTKKRNYYLSRRRVGCAWNGFAVIGLVVVTPPNPARDARVATDSC